MRSPFCRWSEIAPELSRMSPLHPVVNARLPMQAAQAGRVHIFRPEDGGEEHYAIEIGKPDRSLPVLAAASFGLLHRRCSGQPENVIAARNFARPWRRWAKKGQGSCSISIRKGAASGWPTRCAPIRCRIRAFDTVEANHRLGFEDDERDFRIGAGILRKMGFSSVRLLTNNPNKLAMMESCGVTVAERVPLKVGQTAQNAAYLATKAAKSGHLL
jgi:GTP cyclohydrolase II